MLTFAAMMRNADMGPALVLNTDMAREGQVAVAGRFLAYMDDYVPGQERAVGMAGDAFLVALYIGGSARLTMDGLTYELERNNLVACSWEQFRRAKCDAGCRFRCICLSSESARDLAMLAVGNWDVKLYIARHPVLSLTESRAAYFNRYFDLYRATLQKPRTAYFDDLCTAMLQVLIYDLYDFLTGFIQHEMSPYSSGDTLFRNFLLLLHDTYPKPRLIAPYAERLRVTPKYLSQVCKRMCGQSASKLIDDFVVGDIRRLMERRDKTIKEISNELQFPNVSFFGKYVKQHLGLSPRGYRQMLARCAAQP